MREKSERGYLANHRTTGPAMVVDNEPLMDSNHLTCSY